MPKMLCRVRKQSGELFKCRKCGCETFHWVGVSGGDGWAGGDAVDCTDCKSPYEIESGVEYVQNTDE